METKTRKMKKKRSKLPLIIGGAVVAVAIVLGALFATKVLCIHVWQNATCTKPETCARCGRTQGEKLDHDWADATCTEPQICRRCGETQGNALGHTWIDVTCTEPKTCSVCGETEGDALDHDWADATCTEPETCTRCGETHGEAASHDWENATCTEPKTCSVCGTTEGKALGHDWEDATCTEPQTCSRCGETQGEAIGHTWVEATTRAPKYCSVCGTYVASELPSNGTTFVGGSGGSTITIDCSNSTRSYFVKLKDTSGNIVTSFFVRAGYSATINVPMQKLYVYYCCGSEWYGTDYDFGDDAQYYMDDEICDFGTYTFSYTMYATTDGNFSGTSIDPDNF